MFENFLIRNNERPESFDSKSREVNFIKDAPTFGIQPHWIWISAELTYGKETHFSLTQEKRASSGTI
jgi:hypothetical protein